MRDLSDGLARIFRAQKDDFERRMTTLEGAVEANSAGTLGDALRAGALRDAHKLAGSLGMFGLPRGTELARELESTLAQERPQVDAGDGAHLWECVAALRDELEGEFARLDRGAHATVTELIDAFEIQSETPLDGTRPGAVGSGSILVVDDDTAMPGETGLDLVRFALCEHPETATLLISALEDPAIAQVAIDYGAYGYLTKPVRRSAVLIAVMTALRRHDAMLAKTHREKFDGSGYPCGLAGTDIPLEGRIIAVADVYDALTSARAYRPAWSPESAIVWMEGESDQHFDPAVLAAFMSSLDEVQSVGSRVSR